MVPHLCLCALATGAVGAGAKSKLWGKRIRGTAPRDRSSARFACRYCRARRAAIDLLMFGLGALTSPSTDSRDVGL